MDRRVRAKSFDVICAGEARFSLHAQDGGRRGDTPRLRFRPGGGAVQAALTLAGDGLRIGLATVVADDTAGRELLASLVARDIDTEGVELAKPSQGIAFVTGGGGARQVVSYREEEQPISVPGHWSSQVLLLSGMSPIVSHGAALCRAARAARRAGTTVVVDVNARWHLWQGKDPRTIRMVLKEADVVWCSTEDLFGLNLDAAGLRAALRSNAVLVMRDPAGTAVATGPFGEVTRPARDPANPHWFGEDDPFAVAICRELARAGNAGEGDVWARALERGQGAATGRSQGQRR